MLRRLALMEQEVLDRTSRRHRHQVPLEQPEQFLRRCLEHRSISGVHLADGERPSLLFEPEDNPPTPIPAFEPCHVAPAAWGQFGGRIDPCRTNPTAAPIYAELPQLPKNSADSMCTQPQPNVTKVASYRTVDPVVAGS